MRRLCGYCVGQALTKSSHALMARLQYTLQLKKGHEAVVQLLCEVGANKDQPLTNDATPMYIAALIGHEAVVQLLCKVGANGEDQ